MSIVHPALRATNGQPRTDVTVSEWETIICRLTSAIKETTHSAARRRLVQQRMDALAAKDRAWIAREAGLRELLKART